MLWESRIYRKRAGILNRSDENNLKTNRFWAMPHLFHTEQFPFVRYRNGIDKNLYMKPDFGYLFVFARRLAEIILKIMKGDLPAPRTQSPELNVAREDVGGSSPLRWATGFVYVSI